MKRIRSIALKTLATAAVATGCGFGLTNAAAHYQPPQLIPNYPGVGDPMGITGPDPELHVNGGTVLIGRGNVIHLEVACLTSTEAGCEGTLALTAGAGRLVASAPFELTEDQMHSVFLTLSERARRRAARPQGWTLGASASATDTLGREGADGAIVTVKTTRGKK